MYDMYELKWTDEQNNMARKTVMERFATNSIAGHFVPEQTIPWAETTVRSNRFDFSQEIVIDGETLTLYEPDGRIQLTRAQCEEKDLVRAMTTLNRLASALARWHDTLVFAGYNEQQKPYGIFMPKMPEGSIHPKSFRTSAMEAEDQAKPKRNPVSVPEPLNERLVDACYEAVLRLEGDGYYSAYHLILGERLWRALHEPTKGSLVLPRERIEPTLMGGDFHRTTTIPNDEALLISLDGPTLDCVVARGDPKEYPSFEFLRTEVENGQDIYLFRVRERFAPRVRENRAIVRLKIPEEKPSAKIGRLEKELEEAKRELSEEKPSTEEKLA